MAWDDFGIHKEGAQNVQELHVLYAYKDPEFLEDIEALFPKDVTILIGKHEIPNFDHKIVIDGKKLHFPDHQTFLETMYKLNTEEKKQARSLLSAIRTEDVERVANKYAITSKDVWFYLYGNSQIYEIEPVVWQPYKLTFDHSGNYKALFNVDITKEDFMQIWKEVTRHKKEKFGGKIPKNKLPENGKLLYAIFKARQKGFPFSKIYSLYIDKELPYYEKGATGLGSEDKLEEYYRKYRPKLNL